VLVVKRKPLMALAERDGEVARQLWASTAAELNRAQGRLLLLIKSAQERVAGFLLEMAARSSGRDEVDLPMTRQDIGEYLGLTIETVSRTLTSMQETATDRACGVAPRPAAPTGRFGTVGPLNPGANSAASEVRP
jgi:CRP/FNR family transcriptional regulator, nitrogen fixation regulation protein